MATTKALELSQFSSGLIVDEATDIATLGLEIGIDELKIGSTTVIDTNRNATFTGFTSTGIDDNATATALTITADGHIGVGVPTPSAWGGIADNVLEFAGGGHIFGVANDNYFSIGSNTYYDGTVWRYKTAGVASTMYHQDAGRHEFFTSPVATSANQEITTTIESLEINASGNLDVKTKLAVGYSDFTNIPTNGAAFLGSVGIGTNDPQAKLHIRDGIIEDVSGSTIRMDLSGINPFWEIQATNGGTSANRKLNFYAGGGANANVMTLTQAGNVGIGTATPAYNLEAVSPAGSNITAWFRSGDATAANNAGGGFVNTSSATATSREAVMALDADGANASGGDYFLIKKRGNSGTTDFEQYSNASMRFGTNFINRATYDMAIGSTGNVTIGTTTSGESGSAKFTVTGNSIVFNPNTDGKDTFKFTTGAADKGVLYIRNDTTNTIKLDTNGDSYLNGGNVGIGITAPNYNLQVAGSIGLLAGGSSRLLATQSQWGYSSGYRTLILGSTSSTYTTDVSGAVTLAFGVDVSANPSGSFTGDGREVLFRNITHFTTPNSDNTTYLNPLTLYDGKVGIGTTTPSYTLEVVGAAGLDSPLTIRRNDWQAGEVRLNLALQYAISGYISSGISEFVTDTGYIALNYKSGASAYEEGLRVSNTGSVGIGTTTPQTYGKLAVVGNISTIGQANSGAEVNRLQFYNIGATNYDIASIRAIVGAGQINRGELGFYVNNGASQQLAMYINYAQNVGIGTTSPANKLDVRGSVGIGTAGTASLNSLTITSNVSSAQNHSHTIAGPVGGTNDDLVFNLSQGGGAYGQFVVRFNGSNLLYLTPGGLANSGNSYLMPASNFGIGLTDPSAKLHIRGATNDSIVAASSNFKVEAAGGDGIAMGSLTSSPFGSWIQSGYLANGYSPAWNSGYPLLLNPAGSKVGVGTVSPTSTFSVQGNTDLGNGVTSSLTATHTTRLSGYALRYDASNRYGSYGYLMFHANDQWTSSARRRVITNGLNANIFGIIRSVDANTDIVLGDGGVVSSGIVDFSINNTGKVGLGVADASYALHISSDTTSSTGAVSHNGNLTHSMSGTKPASTARTLTLNVSSYSSGILTFNYAHTNGGNYGMFLQIWVNNSSGQMHTQVIASKLTSDYGTITTSTTSPGSGGTTTLVISMPAGNSSSGIWSASVQGVGGFTFTYA